MIFLDNPQVHEVVLIKIFYSIIFVFAITACSEKPTTTLNGPEGSWWTGGADGGVFVMIKDDDNDTDNIYLGTIYYEHDKSIWYQGKFKYSKKTTFNYKNKKLYDGWDGEKLFLTDSSYLIAIDPPN